MLKGLLESKEEELAGLRTLQPPGLLPAFETSGEVERLLKEKYELKKRLSEGASMADKFESWKICKSLKIAWRSKQKEREKRYKDLLIEGDRVRVGQETGMKA